MLQLSHVKKIYKKSEVLSDINYTFNEGKIYPILGGAGAGRTTLFECICGDISIDAGEIVCSRAKGTIFLAAKQSVLPMYITGFEFIDMLCELSSEDLRPEGFFDRVELSLQVQNKLICDYSFEEKKMIQLAAFLVQKPYVMLFDEPLDYCSETYIDKFLEVLNSMKDEHIILVSTGLFEMAKRISDDAIVLNNGELNAVSRDTMEIPEIRQAILDILGEADNEIL